MQELESVARHYCACAVRCRERDIRSTMADNMVALEDRGEKLRNLQDKTADLGDSAADFASVAKALKEQSASRKWWQL